MFPRDRSWRRRDKGKQHNKEGQGTRAKQQRRAQECGRRDGLTCPMRAAVWTSRSTLERMEQLCLKKTHSSFPQQHRSSLGSCAATLMTPMAGRCTPVSKSGGSSIPIVRAGEGRWAVAWSGSRRGRGWRRWRMMLLLSLISSHPAGERRNKGEGVVWTIASREYCRCHGVGARVESGDA